MMSTFLQLAGFSLSSSGIEIDSTPPVVVDLYSPKGTSPWGGVYTVGEEVRVWIKSLVDTPYGLCPWSSLR